MEKIITPKDTALDKVLEAAAASINIIPTGSLINYLIGQIIQTPAKKRMDQWMDSITNAINDIPNAQLSLASNERFVTAFVQASQIAIRNHQAEKLEALRNAVVNSIEPPSYPETIQIHFLNLIDRFTEWHLRVLVLFSDPKWFNKEGVGGYGHGRTATLRFIERYFPFFCDERELLELVLSDLKNAHLIEHFWDEIETSIINRSSSTPTITKLGKNFVSYIRDGKAQQRSQI